MILVYKWVEIAIKNYCNLIGIDLICIIIYPIIYKNNEYLFSGVFFMGVFTPQFDVWACLKKTRNVCFWIDYSISHDVRNR